jgi:hypothetical protein
MKQWSEVCDDVVVGNKNNGEIGDDVVMMLW